MYYIGFCFRYQTTFSFNDRQCFLIGCRYWLKNGEQSWRFRKCETCISQWYICSFEHLIAEREDIPSNLQFISYCSNGNSLAIKSHASNLDGLLKYEIALLKERNRLMEEELKEMQNRYSEISVMFAEVRAQCLTRVILLISLPLGCSYYSYFFSLFITHNFMQQWILHIITYILSHF